MILYRYITREFIRPFLYSLSTIMLLFLMQLVVQLLPKVLYKGVPAAVIVQLFALNLAHIAVLSVPMSLLISMLMVFGKLSSDNELAAIKAGGHSIVSLLPPVVAISALIGTIMLFFNTAILPEANHHSSTLLSDILKKKPAAMIEPGVLIKDFPGYALMVDSVDHETAHLYGIKIFSEERGNKPTVTIAEHGTIFMTADETYVELTLYNGETHMKGTQNTKEHYQINFETQVVHIKNVDSDLKKSKNKNRGDREKTNDQLLVEVEEFKKVKGELKEQQEKRIDELLAFTDSLWILHSLEMDSLHADSVESSGDTPIVASAQSPPEDDSLVPAKSSEDSENVQFSEIRKDTTTKKVVVRGDGKCVDSLEVSPQLALLKEIEKSGKGRKFQRIIKNDFSRSKTRDERTDKQKKKINSHLVEVHKKYALAVSVIVFALLGVPLGIISKSGSVAISVSYSLAFFIIYYVFLVSGEKLSENHGLPPELGMWIGNVVLFTFAVWLISKTARESQLANSKVIAFIVLAMGGWKKLFAKMTVRGAAQVTSELVVEQTPRREKNSILRTAWKVIKGIIFFPSTITRLIMPKLPAYILGRFFSFFLSVILGLIVLTVVIDFVSTISKLEGALPRELVDYYIYFMAWFFSILLPITLLISTMMTIGSFAKTNELTAIKAAGISMVKMTIPLLIVGVFFTGFSFYFTEKVLPDANRKRALLKEVFAARRHNRPIPSGKKSYKHDFYYFSNPTTAYRFTHFQTSPARGDKVMRYRFGDGALLETTECRKMIYEDSSWLMLNGITRSFTKKGYTSKRFGRQPDTFITDSPEEMVKSVGIAQELSHGELKKIMAKAQQRGEDVSRYEADLHYKFALPVMNFIVILIGVSATARSDKRGGAVYFGAGLGLVVLYWAVSQLLLVFGRGGQLSPLFAAWSGTAIFLVIGLTLYRRASQ